MQSLPTLGLGLAPVHRCQELVRSQLLELVEPLEFLKDLENLESYEHSVHPEKIEHQNSRLTVDDFQTLVNCMINDQSHGLA